MRPGGGNLVGLGDPAGRVPGDDNDLCRLRDVDEEAIEPAIVDRPARAARDGNRAVQPHGVDIDHGEREGARHRRISDVGRQQRSTTRIEGEPVGVDPHAHFDNLVLGLGPEDADGVLRAVRREGQVAGPVHEDPGDPRQSADRVREDPARAVDDVHRIVRRVGHVEPARALVDRRVVEAARRGVSGEIDMAGQPERHV